MANLQASLNDPFMRAEVFREAADVQRYHTVRTLRQQTVGQHSFGVMLLLRQVFPEARKEVFLAAMHHDLPELVTGDIPAPVKRCSPTMAVSLENLERGCRPLYEDFALTVFEEMVLKWCDLFELVMWSLEELQMGNLYVVHVCKNGLEWLHERTTITSSTVTGATARRLLIEATTRARTLRVPLDIEQEITDVR